MELVPGHLEAALVEDSVEQRSEEDLEDLGRRRLVA